jgi:sialidase-1
VTVKTETKIAQLKLEKGQMFAKLACGSRGARFTAIMLAGLFVPPEAVAESGIQIVDVFINGQDGYPAFRIPALITTKRGTLLAFAEGRASLRDHAENDIVLKRSGDGGTTWGPLQLVHEDGTNSLGNPTVVIVRETGRALLMYQRYVKGFDEHKAEPGLDGPRICRTLTQYSDDDGATWSKPVDVTAQVKRPTQVLASLPDRKVGCLFERDGTTRISFARFTLNWIEDKSGH